MIKEAYCSFEVAKLLKEKGFDELCKYLYKDNVERYTLASTCYQNVCDEGECLCPTHQMVMKWLREVHNIMISPYAMSLGWYFEMFDLTKRDISGCKPLYQVGIPNKEDILSTYEQAVEAGIKYCLENLI